MSTPLPTTHTIIAATENSPPKNLEIQLLRPLPIIAPDQILLKNVAVALNPCDWKMPDNFPEPGATDGSDFAGVVAQIGSGVTQSFKIGDRVAGAVHGSNPVDHLSGSFGEWVAGTADIMLKIPTHVSWEQAAAVGGTAFATLGLVFFDSMKLPFTPDKRATPDQSFFVLVYGGGTATGTMAIQLLKLFGLRPLAVCSEKSRKLALSYGAESVFNYEDPDCGAKIKAHTGNRLKYVLDIITDELSMKLCYDAMGRVGGTYVGLELLPENGPSKRTVKSSWVMGQSIFGKELHLGGGYQRPAIAQQREIGRWWFGILERLWAEGKIRPHPVKVGEGSFEGILEGVDLMRKRKVAREKLVYLI
ncbi:putative zinc-binding dehydrogenase family oxidoreductase [Tothia fuscella]|uniref:Zinc-binding dehydrogenase family oxidoreductase n=1 Tax=Tothia fuscella TaxID=1048955 RepID=A0A9P4U076_9PEZI|nr:putative zinc-binding dehydrogenase family oxidoreductase [Tothia fuscella]